MVIFKVLHGLPFVAHLFWPSCSFGFCSDEVAWKKSEGGSESPEDFEITVSLFWTLFTVGVVLLKILFLTKKGVSPWCSYIT